MSSTKEKEKKKFRIIYPFAKDVIWHVRYRDNNCNREWIEMWISNVYDATTIIEEHSEHDCFDIDISQFKAKDILGN